VLAQSLEALGIPLVVLQIPHHKDVPGAVADACTELAAKHVFWNKEYEVNEGLRDQTVQDRLKQSGNSKGQTHSS
jgi:deoxyribodipyrimidine photo-lyase